MFENVVMAEENQLKKSNFDMGHDFNSTMCFGELVPLNCQCLPVPSHSHFSAPVLSRAFPLVAPCYGRIAVKQFHTFVGISEVFPKWKNVLSNKQSLMVGGDFSTGQNIGPSQQTKWRMEQINSFPQITADALLHILLDDPSLATAQFYTRPTESTASSPNDSWILQTSLNQSQKSEFYRLAFETPLNTLQSYTYLVQDVNDVRAFSISSADFVSFHHTDSLDYMCAFKLTAKGKRLEKIFRGLGYNLGFLGGSTTPMNLLPLLCYYRAYYLSFGIPNYEDWEDTSCYKVIEFLSHSVTRSHTGITEIVTYNNKISLQYWASAVGQKEFNDLFKKFIYDELAFCIYTDNQLFESLPLGSGLNPNRMPFAFYQVGLNGFFGDVNTGEQTTFVSSQEGMTRDVYTEISENKLSQLQDDLLKRLYLYNNKTTLLGTALEKELNNRGYTDFTKNCFTHFIGSTSSEIEISEVTTTADTSSKNLDGSVVGQPFGRGVGFDENHYFDFDNNEPGWIISMITIVPITKSIQNTDLSLFGINASTFYSPLLDGVGFEAVPQCALGYINGVTHVTGSNENYHAAFGTVPRFTGFKTRKNVLLGGFRKPNEMLSYGAYSLDSYMYRFPYSFEHNESDPGITGFKSHDVSFGRQQYGTTLIGYELPQAGKIWQRTLVSAFFGNFDRIFNQRAQFNMEPNKFGLFSEGNAYESYPYEDSFIVHSNIDFKMTAKMLPISLGFGTTDEGEKSQSETIK